jgi:signal transduction histidine kinase
VSSVAVGLAPGCGGRDAAARFRRAQRLWRERPDFAAGYSDWLALPPQTREGEEARRRLQEAAVHYQRAIELIRHDRPGAREALSDGKRLAPMDPALYLPLARACRDQGIYIRAVDYYRSFLVHRPDAAEAAAARAELHAVDADATVPARDEGSDEDRRLRWLVPLGLAPVVGLGGALLLRLRRPPTLAALALASPELQPTLTYLIGRLRHELLKHRIGAVTDALSALESGESTAAQRLFLADRIFGGEPLLQVWREHMVGFERALGPQKHVLAADPGFRAAGSALAELLRLRAGFLLGQRRALRRMVVLHEELRRFDAALGRLSRRLSRTAIDRPLLEGVLAEVRGEYSARQVKLDEVCLLLGPDPTAAPGPQPIAVEVYRVDLLLVLRNLLRNAILAVGRAGPPRRIGVALSLALLPTGEESVQVHVLDSSPEPLCTAELYAHSGAPGQRAQRGLGLVIAALGLYNGSITVERIDELAARPDLAGPAGPIAPAALGGFEKAVTVHLFRALGSDDEDDGDGPDRRDGAGA